MDKTLVILAAGMGSRYGGLKQIDPVGPDNSIIIDYSIFDALKNGFNKVVFIIRKDIEKDFREVIGNHIEKHVDVEYVFQSLDDLPAGFTKPADRVKPWGTGQAILACKGVVNEPFVVINADDYYGKEGFRKIHTYLEELEKKDAKYDYCMAGFLLGNTLSDNGTVTRGVCKTDDNGMLVTVNETFEIVQKGDVAVGVDEDKNEKTMKLDDPVSMNMWGFTPEFIDELEANFVDFLSNVKEGDIKAEYLLPDIVAKMLKENKATVKVLNSSDKWFGITYQEDKPKVKAFFKELAEKGIYPEKLWN
jgi:dTDP-glucose pyrophosphorylase